MLEKNTFLHGRYRVGGALKDSPGRAVYLCFDGRRSKNCVINEITPSDAEYYRCQKEVFYQTVENLKNISHPNIAKLYDSFTIDNREYIVHEYVEGVNLEILYQSALGPFSIDKTISWLFKILDILKHLHDRPSPYHLYNMHMSHFLIDKHEEIKLINYNLSEIINPAAPEDTNTALSREIYKTGEMLYRFTTLHNDLNNLIFPTSYDKKIQGFIKKCLAGNNTDIFPGIPELNEVLFKTCTPLKIRFIYRIYTNPLYWLQKFFVKNFFVFYIICLAIIFCFVNMTFGYLQNLNPEYYKNLAPVLFKKNAGIILTINEKEPAGRQLHAPEGVGLLIHPKTHIIYLLSGDGSLRAVDPQSGMFVKRYRAGKNISSGCFDARGDLYLCDAAKPYIYRYSLFAEKIIDTIKLKQAQDRAEISPDGKKIISYSERVPAINIINIMRKKVIKTFPFKERIKKMTASSDGNRLFILTRNSSMVIFNLDAMAVERTIILEKNVLDFVLSNNEDYDGEAYLIADSAKKIYVINAYKILREIKLKSPPGLICLSPQGYYLYVYSSDANTISKINLRNNKVVKIITPHIINPDRMLVTE